MGSKVAKTEVSLSSNHPEYPVSMVTADNGHFAFTSNPMYNDYNVSAARNDDYMNGVSTLDLVVIQKHILGLESLNSPYKVIAADINNDSDVSAIDLVVLRKLILGIYSELPNNNSWRFVDASQNLNANSPFPFTEVLNINDLTKDQMSEDFVGVKIGDVTSNVKANNAVSTEVRTNGTLAFNMEDATVNAGETVTINVSSENFNDVYGYQFTMKHTGLSLQSVNAGVLAVSEDNIGVRDGVMSMSWNAVEGVSSSDVLFSMTFKATTTVTLSKAISINSSVTAAEAYVGAGYDQQNVSLNFRNGGATLEAAAFELYQNEPNPFNNETLISFTLPKASAATITVMDVAGKTVKVINGDYAKGYNEVKLTSNDLGVSGLLYYQLESGEYTATKKMILID
jgi:plastocyanin